MPKKIAHTLDEKWRSNDIRIKEEIDFSSLFLSDEVMKGLKKAGYKHPSPIQVEAIPVGRIGRDMIVQAKSGTGKTLVFSIIALEMLHENKLPQVLILEPTREVAYQTCNVIKSVGYAFEGLKCKCFIGGLDLAEDKLNIADCQIVVGTPGRILHLMELKVLRTSAIRLLILDEADELLNHTAFRNQVEKIFNALPKEKQVITTSATYPKKMEKILHHYLRNPFHARLDAKKLSLLGMIHFTYVVPGTQMAAVVYRLKLIALENILLNVNFAQCLVFCNHVSRVEVLSGVIREMGFSTAYISSAENQVHRIKAIECLKRFKCKVLVSSDVTSRGVDAENVNLVINFDLPSNMEQYLHRVGRAGRYGSICASVTLITKDELKGYEQIRTEGKFKSFPVPDPVPSDLIDLKRVSQSENEMLPNTETAEAVSNGNNLNNIQENADQDTKFGCSFTNAIFSENQSSISNLREENNHSDCISESSDNFSRNSLKEGDNLSDTSDNNCNLLDSSNEDNFSGTPESNQNSNSLESLNKDDHLNCISESNDCSNPLDFLKEEDHIRGTSVSKHSFRCEEAVDCNSEEEIMIVAEKITQLHENELQQENSTQLKNTIMEDENIKTLSGYMKCDERKSSQFMGIDQEMKCVTESNLYAPHSKSYYGKNERANMITTGKSDDSKMSKRNKTSEVQNNIKLKEIISPLINFIRDHEKDVNTFDGNFNLDSNGDSQSNDEQFSSASLLHYRSNANQYIYNVYKDFLKDNISPNLVNQMTEENIVEDEKCVLSKMDKIGLSTNKSKNEKKVNLNSIYQKSLILDCENISDSVVSDMISEHSDSNDEFDTALIHENLENTPQSCVIEESSSKSSQEESDCDSIISLNSVDMQFLLGNNMLEDESLSGHSDEQKESNEEEIKSFPDKIYEKEESSLDDSDLETCALDKDFEKMMEGKSRKKNCDKQKEEAVKALYGIQQKEKCFKNATHNRRCTKSFTWKQTCHNISNVQQPSLCHTRSVDNYVKKKVNSNKRNQGLNSRSCQNLHTSQSETWSANNYRSANLYPNQGNSSFAYPPYYQTQPTSYNHRDARKGGSADIYPHNYQMQPICSNNYTDFAYQPETWSSNNYRNANLYSNQGNSSFAYPPYYQTQPAPYNHRDAREGGSVDFYPHNYQMQPICSNNYTDVNQGGFTHTYQHRQTQTPCCPNLHFNPSQHSRCCNSDNFGLKSWHNMFIKQMQWINNFSYFHN
ncbi:probable ATP-dependent RNA helicase DDX20 [Caerostris darwini]|uniref:RNA helicase n=1 Tax=Caerostris darwini TaxID=1538125 RepID=A0AAV4V5U7_9ARAC|nr:probable ATP-dependent RNA helicase DDX20 [Caerostris darwini]